MERIGREQTQIFVGWGFTFRGTLQVEQENEGVRVIDKVTRTALQPVNSSPDSGSSTGAATSAAGRRSAAGAAIGSPASALPVPGGKAAGVCASSMPGL